MKNSWLPAPARSFLICCGIDPLQRWPLLLLSLIFIFPPSAPAGQAWPRRIAGWFPHVQFARFRLADVFRILLQLFWLAVIRPARPDSPRPTPTGQCRTVWLALANGLQMLVPTRLKAIYHRWQLHPQHRLQHYFKSWRSKSEAYAGHQYWNSAIVRYAAYGIAALIAAMCITTPFDSLAQTVFVILLWGLALLIRRIPGPVGTLYLMVLSVTASTRYLWWRMAHTLNWDQSLDLAWGLLLFAAEVYTWLILLLGFIQTAWPLKRSPMPLPADNAQWPTVDIYIPTYNEPLKVLKPTIYAAMSIDWPRSKMNIYLLDDGRRDEFRLFAEQLGIGYIIRPDNRHAKAGNLNHALTKTSGEYIAIFDCDHIPTRSFLQMTMGWFLRDPKLAMLQTPHHFFSPDPFERNLNQFRHIPNEGELFYGLIQDGNDLWNATFFCGSCAVLRRKPLEQIGGIAVETVTEDAHTALKMQRLGYSTAYLKIPQAAGLATESLSAHIGQRIRWARGMAQIFRLDNPFFGKGLRWAQRICYGNAMLHFLNGGPRLVFLTAPLAFLLFHAYVIYTPAISVLLFVLPHIIHANITNSRIQGGFRHSFWAEVYETVLAWYILRPTTVALFAPHKGSFNVTAKGGMVDKDYFDWTISLPYLTIVGLNLLGFGFGLARLAWGPDDEMATTLLNLFWTTYNILLLGAAIAVASESKQTRHSHRVQLHLPAILRLPDGKLIRCHTEDFSEGGAALNTPLLPALASGTAVSVILWRGEEEWSFPAIVTASSAPHLRLRWNLTSVEQEMVLIQCTFARSDAWVSWSDNRNRDRPLTGLKEVLLVGASGYLKLSQHLLPFALPILHRLQPMYAGLLSLLPRTPAALPQVKQ